MFRCARGGGGSALNFFANILIFAKLIGGRDILPFFRFFWPF